MFVKCYKNDLQPLPPPLLLFIPTSATVYLSKKSSRLVINIHLLMDINLSFLCYAFFFVTVFLSLSIFPQCDMWLLGVNFLPHHCF